MRAPAVGLLIGLAACGGPPGGPAAALTLVVSARMDGEIEPCG